MNFKSIVTLLIFLIWSLICWRWYINRIKFPKNAEQSIAGPIKFSPLMFYANSDKPFYTGFEKYRDSICKLTDSNRIDIVGYFYADETNKTVYDNLGMARAMRLKSMLMGFGIDSSKVAIFSQRIDSAGVDSVRLATEIKINKSNLDLTSKDVQIVMSYGTAEVYFPLGSKSEVKSAKLDSFLKDIATQDTNKRVIIKGHTDNEGSVVANLKLSIDRCQTIKSKLVEFGVKENRVLCEGKGSSSPKVENTTPENKALNRRVEIKLE